MTNLISFPFRLAPNGSVVTRPDDSAEYHAEEITGLCMTRPGERPQIPSFGIGDPTYNHMDGQELSHKLAKFQIPVRIVEVTERQVTNSQQDLLITFTPTDNGTGPMRVNFNDLG